MKKLILLMISMVFVCPIAGAQTLVQDGKVSVVMHRGDWRHAPENSLPAIQNSINMGAEMVEIDIKRTSDGVLVLMHDRTVDRTTNGTGPVEDMTFAQTQELRLINGIGRTTTHQIPTLEEALRLCRGKIWVNIDKGYDYFNQIIDLLEKTETTAQVLIKSSHPYPRVASENPLALTKLFYMPIVNANDSDARKFVDEYLRGCSPKAFEVCFSEYNAQVKDLIEHIQESGSLVWVNTLWDSLCGGMSDDRAVEQGQMEECYGVVCDLGVSFIQTDRPAELIKYLESRNLR